MREVIFRFWHMALCGVAITVGLAQLSGWIGLIGAIGAFLCGFVFHVLLQQVRAEVE